jgi:hypothetical protein
MPRAHSSVLPSTEPENLLKVPHPRGKRMPDLSRQGEAFRRSMPYASMVQAWAPISRGMCGRGGRWVLARGRVELERFSDDRRQADRSLSLGLTVKCENCRATIPLLKTKWRCKRDNKCVLLNVEPIADRSVPVFSFLYGKDAATHCRNAAQGRERYEDSANF